MSVPDFTKRMDVICGIKNLEVAKACGLALIITELGEGMPGFLPSLEKFLAHISSGVDAEKRNARAERRRAQNERAQL